MQTPKRSLNLKRPPLPRILSLSALIGTAAVAQYVLDLHYLVGVYAAVSASALVEAVYYFASANRRSLEPRSENEAPLQS